MAYIARHVTSIYMCTLYTKYKNILRSFNRNKFLLTIITIIYCYRYYFYNKIYKNTCVKPSQSLEYI